MGGGEGLAFQNLAWGQLCLEIFLLINFLVYLFPSEQERGFSFGDHEAVTFPGIFCSVPTAQQILSDFNLSWGGGFPAVDKHHSWAWLQ